MKNNFLIISLVLLLWSTLTGIQAQNTKAIPEGKDVKVTYVGNSGFLINIGDKKILIDALFKGFAGNYELPQHIQKKLKLAQTPFDEVDLILVTHAHGDHINANMVNEHMKNNPGAVFASTKQAVDMLKGFSNRRIIFNPSKEKSDKKNIQDISIESFYLPHGPNSKIVNIGFLVSVNGVTFFQTGDVDFGQFTFDEFRSFQLPEKKIDLLFIQHYYLRGDSLNDKFVNEAIGGKYIIPIHYHFTSPAFDKKIIRQNYPDAIIFKEELQSWRMPDKKDMFPVSQADKVMSWNEFDKKVDQLIESEKNTEAIKLLKESFKNYPEKEFEIYQSIIILYKRAEEIKTSIDMMTEANNKGYYFWLMPRERAYNNYRREEWFKKALALNNELRDKAQKLVKPGYKIVLPKKYDVHKKYPLIFIMHGGNQNIEITQKRWRSDELYKNNIVAFVQSGWTVATKRFRWNLSGKDLFHEGSAIDEVKVLYKEILQKYPVNTDKIVLVGFSQGAALAMNMSIHNDIKCIGVLAGCPFNDDIDEAHSLNLKKRDIRFFVFTGDKDFAFKRTKKNMEILKKSGVKVIFKINKNMGHEFSFDIESDIKEALKLILE
ncbi:MAG: MBL fold metallo-hydrolase [Acidobacteriota bacterium]